MIVPPQGLRYCDASLEADDIRLLSVESQSLACILINPISRLRAEYVLKNLMNMSRCVALTLLYS
jgi:hypothetical protein